MTIRVRALTESDWLKPDGDCHAPQVVLTGGWGRWNVHELNADTLPFDGHDFLPEVVDHFRTKFRHVSGWKAYHDEAYRAIERYFKIFWGLDALVTETRGHSQGDYGVSIVFATPEFIEMTGAPGVTETDHIDFCAWLWGDVYEVAEEAVTHTEVCSLGHEHVIEDVEEELVMHIYGMDEAWRYAKENGVDIEFD